MFTGSIKQVVGMTKCLVCKLSLLIVIKNDSARYVDYTVTL